ARRIPDVCPLRCADCPGDADVGGDGGREPVDRVLRRLRGQGAGRLGRLFGGLAVLVLLGDRRRVRGGGRRQSPQLLVSRAAVGAVAVPCGVDYRDELVLRGLGR